MAPAGHPVLAKGEAKAHLLAMRSPFSFRRTTPHPEQTPAATLPAPEAATYVVGDLHGRADLLQPIFERIDLHIGTEEASNPYLVFVGDYIDYGPDSRGTLLRMKALTEEFPRNVICLMGNHERMLLDFLSDPELRGSRWIRAGGAATLQSFGVAEPERSPDGYDAAANALLQALDPGLLDWIAARPLSWHSGNLWVVHAGADPKHAMPAQPARVLLWGHPEFEAIPRDDNTWIAHGHTEIPAPRQGNGRINVDTGAWQTGRLTAAAILPDGQVEFLSTEG